MTDKVEQIRNGVKRLLNEPTPSHDSQCNWEDGYWCALYKIEEFIDSMQEEHVNYDKLKTMLEDALAKETKESLNERFGEEPKAKFKNGDTIRYTDGDIRTVVEVREDCYKLDDFSILHFNAQDNWELVREPVSEIDFEQELYKAFGRVKDFTLGMRIAKRFYEMGIQHQEPVSEEWIEELRTKLDSLSKEDFKKVFDKYAIDFNEEPVSDDLEEEIIRYIGYPQEVDEDVSTTMIRKAARHFANWQKKQMINKATKWLEENLAKETPVIVCGSVSIGFEHAIEDLKKVMED